MVGIDEVLTLAHSEKEDATATWKETSPAWRRPDYRSSTGAGAAP